MTQWDDQNRETRQYQRQDGQPGYGDAPRGDRYAGGDQYGDPYRREPAGYEAGQRASGQQPGRRPARFEDSTSNPFGAASNQAFGIVSTVLALLGGILGIVTLTGLEWFKGGVSFSETHQALDGRSDATGFAAAYFGWLAWVFLIVAVLAGVMASFPSPALRAFRVIGVVIGFAAAGLSFLAIQLFQDGYLQYLKDVRIGFYLLVVAYVLTGIGSAIGPRKV